MDLNGTNNLSTPQSRNLADKLEFCSEYAAYMFGCGVHTSRVIRCTERIAQALHTVVEISYTFRHFVITMRDGSGHTVLTRVATVQMLPISFQRNTDLSALSWQAVDENLTLDQLKERYKQLISKPRINPQVVLVLVGLANACFCRLFGGDALAMLIVFISTVAGFGLRQYMQRRHVNHFIVFVAAAYVASMCASVSLLFDCTAQIAIATSPLFLIPGVPLINSFVDVLDGHVLVGFSRLVSTLLLIMCIAIGLSFTLMIMKGSIL